MNTIVLENETLRLVFDDTTGALVGLTALPARWELLNRPHLGLSFRLLVPLSEERRNNPVFGEKQRLSSASVAPDGHSAEFVWQSVVSEHGGMLPIGVRIRVDLTQRQAMWTATVVNRSPYIVESVYVPYLGDVQPPPAAEWFKTFSFSYGTAQERSLWPVYDPTHSSFAVDFPTQMGRGWNTPTQPYTLLRSQNQGLYVGVQTPSCELVAWQTELRPGLREAMDNRVPTTDTIGGKDVCTRFAAVHQPYVQPGEARTLTPIALEAFQGGWQHGVDIYKRWRQTWMHPSQPPKWARQPHAWLQLHINSPEDELRMRFTDLVHVGEECAHYGVKVIQLVGWNDGGQDQGNPSHDPDPRLGTFEELRQAIADIQKLGVKVVLFAKFTWADRATQRFRNDLVRLAVKDPYGDYYHYPGYPYQTPAQLLDINTKRLIPMCFLSEEYLGVCAKEFAKTVALGADGILYDECQHHTPALVCFDVNHGHRYGAPIYANDRELIRRFARIAPAGFLFAGEACYDWEFEVYHLSYFRSCSKQHIPLSRYMLPEAQLMTAIMGFDDRSMINQCLLYRYIMSYEPYYFKGRLSDFPLTMAYGQKMDALRSELRAYFWDGEFRDKLGASVTVGGRPHHPYSVFVNRDNGRLGVVIANDEDDRSVVAAVRADDGQPLTRYRLVDDPIWRPAGPGVEIPPRSAAVVIGTE